MPHSCIFAGKNSYIFVACVFLITKQYKRVKIAVNTRLLLQGKLEGIGWFMYESLKRICTQHPEHEFVFIFDRAFDPNFIFSKNVKGVVVGPPARHPILYYIWFNYSVARLLKKEKVDLFLSPDGYLPLHSSVKSLAVFHDINFEHYPQDFPIAERFYYRRYFPRFAQVATRLATVSQYSKQDIMQQYGIADSKIDVVYNGANEAFVPLSEAEKTHTQQAYAQGKPYFVFVGALNPRKNLVNLLSAFDTFKQDDKQGVKLLVVGEKMFKTKKIFDTYEQMRHKDEVIFTGRLDSQALHHVLASALALTYVSYFEGFGIPIVEAFYAGTPVITSNITSMPEIAADAALLVDPFDAQDIAQALRQIAQDNTLRQSLIDKGNLRKQDFHWQKTADKLWQAILNTAATT